jgi:hypothetical protein
MLKASIALDDNLKVARTDCRPLKSSADGSGSDMLSVMVNLLCFAIVFLPRIGSFCYRDKLPAVKKIKK